MTQCGMQLKTFYSPIHTTDASVLNIALSRVAILLVQQSSANFSKNI